MASINRCFRAEISSFDLESEIHREQSYSNCLPQPFYVRRLSIKDEIDNMGLVAISRNLILKLSALRRNHYFQTGCYKQMLQSWNIPCWAWVRNLPGTSVYKGIAIVLYKIIFLHSISSFLSRACISVGCASNWYSGGCRFNPPVWQLSVMEIGHEIISTAVLSLPLIQVGQLSVTDERMCT